MLTSYTGDKILINMVTHISIYSVSLKVILGYNTHMISNKELEEQIYEFGSVMYKLGRLETDGKETLKEYNQCCKKREELTKGFDELFKSKTKLFL